MEAPTEKKSLTGVIFGPGWGEERRDTRHETRDRDRDVVGDETTRTLGRLAVVRSDTAPSGDAIAKKKSAHRLPPGHVSVRRLVVPTAGLPRPGRSWLSPCPKPEALATDAWPKYNKRSAQARGPSTRSTLRVRTHHGSGSGA
jgi:hypothetical protein